jgi:hypothetical protein
MHVANIITTMLLKVNSCVLVALHVLIHILGFFSSNPSETQIFKYGFLLPHTLGLINRPDDQVREWHGKAGTLPFTFYLLNRFNHIIQQHYMR